MSTVVEHVARLVAPILADLGVELYDLEHTGPVLKVVVDRPGGVDLDTLAEVTRNVSRALDHDDPMPGRYTLEVTSPGLERTLRTPTHFARAVGEKVALRTLPGVEGERRVAGVLVSAGDDGVVVSGAEGERRLAYDDIERARTVFEWGPAPKPGASRRRAPRADATSEAREEEESEEEARAR